MDTYPTLFIFSSVEGSQLFFLPNWILLLLKNDPSKEISQTSEIWELVPGIHEAHSFQMGRPEEEEAEEQWKKRKKEEEEERQILFYGYEEQTTRAHPPRGLETVSLP